MPEPDTLATVFERWAADPTEVLGLTGAGLLVGAGYLASVAVRRAVTGRRRPIPMEDT